MRFDVIVAGAGPAGSTTARECAQLGMTVLMLDKADFPRDKPCGGGVTPHAAGMLPFDLDPVVERTISGFHLTHRRAHETTRRTEELSVLMTQRSNLDAYLAEKAVEAGARFVQRSPVRAVVRRPDHVIVRANGTTYEGRTLVAADGANGVTTKLAGLDVTLSHGVALEANITPPGGVPAKWADSLAIDVGDLPGGYGWLFPKGDHVNIGLGAWRYFAPKLRERLNELTEDIGFDPADLWGLRAHHLPLRSAGSQLADGNVLLVGDAAGLIDPLTGEGISNAIQSGTIAARHLHSYVEGEAPDLTGYGAEIRREVVLGLMLSRKLHDVFHLSPGIFHFIERRTGLLWRGARAVLTGRLTYAGVVRRLGGLWTAVEFISDLVRINPYLQRRSGLQDPAPPERFFRRDASKG